MVRLAKTVTVSVRLLGPPRLELDGRAVAVDTRKALALVAYLALARRPVARDEVAAVLWPESDHVRARAALRRTLSSLQSALGGHGLVVEGDTLALDAGAARTDVAEFRMLAVGGTTDALSAAAAVYGGDFLAGFALRDSAEFDEWQLASSDELRRDLASVLERLTDALGASDDALRYARRWLDLDPLHEPAHRALMRIYAGRGDRASALRQYRECVAVLERELGVEPLEETTALYEAIREDKAARAVSRVPAAAAAAPLLPLVGRDDDVRALRAAYSSISGDGRLIVVGGEPGIGKTRLASEFCDEVSARGGVVLAARCHPDEERLAFGTIVELLRDARERPGLRQAPAGALGESARLVPELAPEAPARVPLDSPAARRRLFDAIADVLAAACAGPVPGVVLVDDAHWADASSVDAIGFLVRRLAGRPMCVVLTWRTEEVPPAHPLRRAFAAASRDARATGMTLARLSQQDVTDLLRASGGDADMSRTLFEESAGVPFFVTEYLSAVGTGDALPSGVRDLLASRVERVGRSAAQVLAAAAVVGRPFDLELVRAASGRSPDETAAAVDDLVAHGLLAAVGDLYDFTHPKLRDYAYESATHARRRLVHGRAGAAFARRARRRPDLAAIAARHLERAGRDEEAADLYVTAGDHARSVFANAEALAHYRSALGLGHPDAASLHETVGDLLTLQGAYRDAIASYETAAALGDTAEIERKLGGVHHRLGDWDAADAHYAEAGDGARVLADRSLNAHRAGRDDDARALVREALKVAADDRSLAQAHNVSGIVTGSVDDFEASLALAEKLDDPSAIVAALNNLALALQSQDPRRARQLEERALELCARIGDRHREAALHSNLADLLRADGQSEEAMHHIKASAALFAGVGSPDELQPAIWKLVEW
jgi:DNA-binding SARP family transcriptional activator